MQHSSQTPQLDCEILLSFVLGKNKAFLISYKDDSPSPKEEQKFIQLVYERAKGAPIAYLTRVKEFYSLPFYVDRDVLIPRPETEELVDLAFKEIIRLIKGGRKVLSVVDVGTGSGNIGITLIYKVVEHGLNKKMKFIFYLTDISGKALKIARKNFKKLIKQDRNIKVKLVKADLLKGLAKKFDVIVSNPPYIPRKDFEYLDPSVRKFEPRVALNGGQGGLETVSKLISQSVKRLERGGVLLFEMHEAHPNKIKFLLNGKYSEWKSEFYKDSFGEWRFTKIKSKRKSQRSKL